MNSNNKYVLTDTRNNNNYFKIYSPSGSVVGYDVATLESKKNDRIINEINEYNIFSKYNNEMYIFLFENYDTGEPTININKRDREDKFFLSFTKTKNNKNKIRFIARLENNDIFFIAVVSLILKLNTAIRDKSGEDEATANLQNYILFNIEKLPEWFIEYPIYINYSGSLAIIDYLTPSIITSQNKKLYEPSGDDQHYITPNEFIRRYKLRGKPRNIPYINYDNNNNMENLNCVKYHILNTYKKISQKTINKLFTDDDNITIEHIINFTNIYKIPLILYDIAGQSKFNNKLTNNKTYKRFIAICANNHLYPLKPEIIKNGIYSPELNTTKNEIYEDLKNDIQFIKNDLSRYTADGKQEIKNEYNESKKAVLIFDKEFIKGISPNYTHPEDTARIRSLFYIEPNIKDYRKPLIEYDIKKAFYNVAFNIVSGYSFCPVFSAVDIWQEYKKEKIDIYNYYLISQDGQKLIYNFGCINNLLTGYLLELFIKEGIIKKSHILYYKTYTSLIKWESIKERIKKLEEKENIKSNYLFYNGLLGQHQKENKKGFLGLEKDELIFLNADYDKNEYNDKWQKSKNENNEDYIFTSSTTHKILNTLNIYEYVIANTNYFLLKFIFDVKRDYKNIQVLKIRVDSVIFSEEIDILKYSYNHFFHGGDDEPHIKANPTTTIYYNGQEIINNIKNTLEIFKNNIVYTGQAGTGKTHLIKTQNLYNIGSTVANLALLNIKDNQEDKIYKTVYKLLSLYNPENIKKIFLGYKNKVIWLDEFGLINNHMWSLIFELAKNYNIKLILTGDLNQLEPVKGDKINENLLFFKMLLINNITLLKDYRNDEETIKIRNEILKNDYSNISECKKSFLNINRHLCYTNKCRHIINYKIMTHNKFKFELVNNKYIVSVGVVLYVSETEHNKGFFKNDIWKVKENENEYSILKSELRKNEELKILNNEFKYFKVGFAGTVHSSQGQTIKNKYAIHQINKMKYRGAALYYTALTRATSYKNIYNYFDEPDQEETQDYINYLRSQEGNKPIIEIYEDEQDKNTAPHNIILNFDEPAEPTPEPEPEPTAEQQQARTNILKYINFLDDNTE